MSKGGGCEDISGIDGHLKEELKYVNEEAVTA